LFVLLINLSLIQVTVPEIYRGTEGNAENRQGRITGRYWKGKRPLVSPLWNTTITTCVFDKTAEKAT
jgi:hypothetical protein